MFVRRGKDVLSILMTVSFAFLLLVEPHDSGFAQSSGSIIRVAGTGAGGFGGDGGPAESARICKPRGIFLDSQKNLYIADTGNYRVRKVTAEGIISTVAGTGVRSSYGDGGPAISAGLELPTDIAIDSVGNLYIADSNDGLIRKVTPEGVIDTMINGGYFIGGITVDEVGNLYFSESDMMISFSDDRIHKVTPDGVVSTVAGGGTEYPGDGSPATSVELHGVGSIEVDKQGNLFFAEWGRVRKVGPDGVINTVAGNGIRGYSGEGDLAVLAQVVPAGIAVDPSGNLYIADPENNCIRKVTTDGMISTILSQLNGPSGIEFGPEGNLYIAERNGSRILKAQLGSAMYFPEIIAGDGWSTQLTITNTGSTEASGSLVFKNPAGDSLAVNAESTDSTGTTHTANSASSFAITIPPNGTVFLSTISSDNQDEFQTGWAELQSTGGQLSGTATYEFAYNAYAELFFSIPSSPLIQMASIPIHNDDAIGKQTAYAIANPGSAPVSVNLVLVDQAGRTVDDSFVFGIDPGHQIARYLFQDLACLKFRGSAIFYSANGQPFVLFALVEKQGLFTAQPATISQ